MKYINSNSEEALEYLKKYNVFLTGPPGSGKSYLINQFIEWAYNSNKKLVTSSTTLKNNLTSYINQFRMVTDAINIKDAFYINIGVNFDVVVASGYNNNDVVTNYILSLKDHFDINKWNINQPIILSDITSLLLQVKGVQNVIKVEVINKQGGNYSPYAYDIPGATRLGNIYPSVDPSVFEVRFPDLDIQGRVVPF